MRTIIVLLKRYVPSLGWVFVACLALGLLGQIILLAQPQYGGALIQAAQEGANAFDPLIILLILLAASALLTMGQQVLIAKIGEGLAIPFVLCFVGFEPGSSTFRLVFSAHCK